MKVAMITSGEEACGIADYTRALVAALRQQIEVKLVPLQRGRRGRGYFQSLGQACNDCDLAHIQHEYVFFSGLDPWNYRWPELLAALRVPYVVTSHTWLKKFTGGPFWKKSLRNLRDGVYQFTGWTRYLEAGQFLGAKRLIVLNRAYAQALLQQGLPAQAVITQYQGVPQDLPTGDPARAQTQWGLQGPVVVIFGFLNPAKGHLLALQAWSVLSSKPTLVMVGQPFSKKDEPYARQVAAAAKPFGERVKMTGYLSSQELADVLAAAQVKLLPYLSGTSSYALSVLLAHGGAVLASDLDCFQEIYAQSACLKLFRAGQPEDLSLKLQALLSSAPEQQSLQAKAKEWAQEHSWEQVAKETIVIYTKVIKEQNKKI